jgi:hypothetical protein
LFGEHAEGFFRKLLVNINECEGKDTFDYEGKIKSAITENKATINAKHLRPFEIDVYARMIIFTNKPNPIPIDNKSKDRRFVVFETTDMTLDKVKCGDKFWKRVVERFQDPIFISSLYYRLSTMNIDDFDFVMNRPITQAYKDMLYQYIPPVAVFFEHFIDNRCFEPHQNPSDIPALPPMNASVKGQPILQERSAIAKSSPYYKKECLISSSVLYQMFVDWSKDFHFYREGPINIIKWHAQITDLKLPVVKKKNNTSNQSFIPEEVYNHLVKNNWVAGEEHYEPTIQEDSSQTDYLFEM